MIKEQILSGEAECAFVITGPVSYTYYVNNLSMYDGNTATADELFQNIYRMSAMIEKGIDPMEAGTILNVQIEHEIPKSGKRPDAEFLLYIYHDFCIIYGDFALRPDGGYKCCHGKKLQGYGTAHYQRETVEHDVWKGDRVGTGRADSACSCFWSFCILL